MTIETFGLPDPRGGLACPVSEDHELAIAVDDNDTAYCVDCGRRQKLVKRTAVKVRPAGVNL